VELSSASSDCASACATAAVPCDWVRVSLNNQHGTAEIFLLLLHPLPQEINRWKRVSDIRNKDRADPAWVTEAKQSISCGAATRYEMNISQGLRKRSGQARSQHFLDALKGFQKVSFHSAEEMVHAGLLAAAQAELSTKKVNPEEKPTEAVGDKAEGKEGASKAKKRKTD